MASAMIHLAVAKTLQKYLDMGVDFITSDFISPKTID